MSSANPWSAPERFALWVAGRPVEQPRLDPSELLAVVDLLDAHCLLGRAIERLSGDDGWISTELVRLLAGRQAAMEELVDEQRHAVTELANAVGPTSVAILKGMAIFGLTNQSASLRTGDVDVIVGSAVDIAEVMSDLGYHQTRGPFMHERGEFTRGSIEIDVHDHYPVSGLPHVDPAAPAVRSESALGDPRRRALSSEQLLSGARPAIAPRLAGLPLVAPEELVIILAAHSFMNFVNAWSFSHRSKVYVRLGELLDVELLIGQPDFRHGRLLQLVTEVGAEDAIGFVRHLGRKLLGRDLVPGVSLEAETIPPRCIWWDTWVESPLAPESLLRTEWYDIDRLVGDVGPLQLRPSVTLQIDGTGLAQGVLATSGNAPSVWCRLVTKPVLQIEFGTHAAHRDDPLRLRIDGGAWSVEWSRSGDQALGSFSGTVDAEVADHDGKAALRVQIPDLASTRAFVGVAVAGEGRTTEATVVAVEWGKP